MVNSGSSEADTVDREDHIGPNEVGKTHDIEAEKSTTIEPHRHRQS